MRLMRCLFFLTPLLLVSCGNSNQQPKPNSEDALPFATIYEPKTSLSTPVTVCWKSNESLIETASSKKRPQATIVHVDDYGAILPLRGSSSFHNLDEFAHGVAKNIIPVFEIKSTAAAFHLKQQIQDLGLKDCFVLSTPNNIEDVALLASSLHVRGMLDYRSESIAEEDVPAIISNINRARGKVVLMSEDSITKSIIQRINAMGVSIWAECKSNYSSLLPLLIEGIDGFVVDDYMPALDLVESFHDELPSLMQIPNVIGHRGVPSMCAENTILSASEAIETGAQGLETDIQISRDGTPFILHDDTFYRLFGVESKAESLSMDEIKNLRMCWDPKVDYSVPNANHTPASKSRYGKIDGSTEKGVVPTLDEYLNHFSKNDVVHYIEIKSEADNLLPILQKTFEKHAELSSKVILISFYKGVLEKVSREYPELSLGALGMEGVHWNDCLTSFPNLPEIEQEQGIESAMAALFETVTAYNSSYHPAMAKLSPRIIRQAKYRGLDTMTWTYEDSGAFATHYSRGFNSLTTDYSWWAGDLLLEISFDPVTSNVFGKSRLGEKIALENAEPIELSDASGAYRFYRYKEDIKIAGTTLSSHYLYSMPERIG